MASIPCLKSESRCNPCAGDSSNPFANLTIEPFDRNIWTGVVFGRPPNVTPNVWTTDACVGFCESAISQLDADDCARRRAEDCLQIEPPYSDPPPPEPPVSPALFCNQEVSCQSGSSCYTLPACTVFAGSQAEADAIAQSLCNSRVLDPEQTGLCLPPAPPPPPPPPPEAPLDATCGTPTVRISGYNATIAQAIVDLMPNSNPSILPEWDGVFRDDGSGSSSHSECYSILGKEINLNIVPNSSLAQEINCTFGGNPGFWNNSGPGDCSFCSDNLEFTLFSTDYINVGNGIDDTQIMVNQGMDMIGQFQLYVGPSCNAFIGPNELYHVTGDVALPTIGPAYFSMEAIP